MRLRQVLMMCLVAAGLSVSAAFASEGSADKVESETTSRTQPAAATPAEGKSDDERMVCEHRAKLGSNRKERVCMTVAQKEAQRQAAREQLERRGGGKLD